MWELIVSVPDHCLSFYFIFCTQLFTEKHVYFTSSDDVMTLILFKFLYCSFYDKKKKIIIQ